MKKFGLLLMIATMLAGCEKDDANNHTKSTYNRLIKSITCNCWYFEGGDETYTYDFQYDDKNR